MKSEYSALRPPSLLLWLALAFLFYGCTIAPKIVTPHAPSLDSGEPNSGIIAAMPGNRYVVTPMFNAKYATLVTLYGNKLLPPMKVPEYITPYGTNYFLITSDGINAYAQLMFYYRQHLTP
jgi:hypothetical protein